LKTQLTIKQEKKIVTTAVIVPVMIILFIFIITPIISIFVFSFTSADLGFAEFDFIGLKNYLKLFQSDRFQDAIITTIIFLGGTIILQMILGIGIAILMFKTKFLKGLMRTIILVPMIISPIIVGIIWRIILMPSYGGLNLLLQSFGISNPPPWLASVFLARLSIIIAATWEWTPFVILLILAGLESLPEEPFEALKIDGANFFQENIYYTLPMLRNVIYVIIVFRVIEGLKIFPLIYAMTRGGPADSTMDLTYFIYTESFQFLKVGYASASSVILLLITLIVILLLNRIFGKRNTI